MKFQYMFNDLTAYEVEHKLRMIVDNALHEKYGDKPDELIAKRVAEEWAAMERTDAIADVAALYELVIWLKENRIPYWMRGLSGSSFIMHLLGITIGNPLPSHYYCPACKTVQWMPFCKDGFDLQQNVNCTNDGAMLIPDGHGVPWQTLWGYGEFTPTFDIDLPSDTYETIQTDWDSHWLKNIDSSNVLNNPYEGEKCIKISNLSLMFRLNRNEISPDFYNREYTAADRDFMCMKWNLIVNDESDFVDTLPKPNCVADMLALCGLDHSMGVWDDATEFMIDEMGYSPSDMIAHRDDVYDYLVAHGFLEKDAWRGMNCVRKGKALPVITEEMKCARDKWVLESCKRIEYLFPKAPTVEFMFFVLKSQV